jgi:hypothetical protein
MACVHQNKSKQQGRTILSKNKYSVHVYWHLIQAETETNSVVWVRVRTIPTERPRLVGEVSANFCG